MNPIFFVRETQYISKCFFDYKECQVSKANNILLLGNLKYMIRAV